MAEGRAAGRSIPIVGGEGDGSMFFVGDTVVVTDAMDAMTSVPVDLGHGEERVYAYWTFVGRDAGTKEPKAVTLVMGLDMLRAMPGAARKLFLGVPIQLRTVGPVKPSVDTVGREELLAALEAAGVETEYSDYGYGGEYVTGARSLDSVMYDVWSAIENAGWQISKKEGPGAGATEVS